MIVYDMINRIVLGHSNLPMFGTHIAFFFLYYSNTPNQTFIKALVDMMVLNRLWKHTVKNMGKNAAQGRGNMGPVTRLVVGNQPPLSVAFRYCNNI